MKITRIEDIQVDGGWDSFCFLKISTDEGVTGWSEFNESRGKRGLSTLIQGLCAPLIGQDPRHLNGIEAYLAAASRSTAGGLMAHAAGAIVNACVDIKARSLGLPVYDLLGGALRDRIPLYWSRCGVTRAKAPRFFDGRLIDKPAVRTLKDVTAAAREARERGFKALKCNLLMFDGKGARAHTPGSSTSSFAGAPDLNITPEIEHALLAQLEALREGAGPFVSLLVDLNFNYRTEGFKRLAKKVEPFNLMWLEMDLLDPVALAGIRQSTTTPIGSLEAVLGRRPLKGYLEARAVDVAIIDIQYNGILESLRMASMCDVYETNVASHGFAGPLSSLMSAHFCAVVPNLRIMEIDIDEVPWRPKLLTEPYTIEDGHLVLPKGPGWGAEVDEAVARAHPVKG